LLVFPHLVKVYFLFIPKQKSVGSVLVLVWILSLYYYRVIVVLSVLVLYCDMVCSSKYTLVYWHQFLYHVRFPCHVTKVIPVVALLIYHWHGLAQLLLG
jgi:hypothetical protein